MPVLPVWLLAVTVGHSAEAQTVGPWRVEMGPDLVVVTQPARPAWPGGGPILVLRCRIWEEKNKLIGKHHRERDAYLSSGSVFTSKNADLLVTFDDEAQPKKFWGSPSVDRHAYFLQGGGFLAGVDGFIRALRAHSKKMTLVVAPKKEQPRPEVSFDLTDLDKALQPLLELCPMK